MNGPVKSPEFLIARHSGLVIRKRTAVFREGMESAALLAERARLRETSWCWHFTNQDVAMDGMAHRFMSWTLSPLLHRYFAHREQFSFHLFDKIPALPYWVDGEYDRREKAFLLRGDTGKKPAPSA